jgi:hypothetical protein
MKRQLYLDRVDFTVLGTHPPPPSLFQLLECLRLALKVIERFPAVVKLLAKVCNLVGMSSFGLLDTFIKLKLDLAEHLEPAENEVVEDTKVGERLRFTRRALLLQIWLVRPNAYSRLYDVPATCRVQESCPCTGR